MTRKAPKVDEVLLVEYPAAGAANMSWWRRLRTCWFPRRCTLSFASDDESVEGGWYKQTNIDVGSPTTPTTLLSSTSSLPGIITPTPNGKMASVTGTTDRSRCLTEPTSSLPPLPFQNHDDDDDGRNRNNNNNNTDPDSPTRRATVATTTHRLPPLPPTSTTRRNTAAPSSPLQPHRRVSRTDTVHSHHRRQAHESFSFSVDSLQQINSSNTASAVDDDHDAAVTLSFPPVPVVAWDQLSLSSYSSSNDNDDDDDDHTFFSSDSATSNNNHNDDPPPTSSPTSVVVVEKKETTTTTTTTTTDNIPKWMVEWASTAATPEEEPMDAATIVSSSANVWTTACYFPTHPRPKLLRLDDGPTTTNTTTTTSSDAVVVLQGWAVVAFGDKNDNVPCGDAATTTTTTWLDWSWQFVQIHHRPGDDYLTCTITTTSSSQPKKKTITCGPHSRLCVRTVSDRAGQCLTIYNKDIDDHNKEQHAVSILPVLWSPQQICQQLLECSTNNKNNKNAAAPLWSLPAVSHVDDDDDVVDVEYLKRYAPPEQQEAVLHWRFCLDMWLLRFLPNSTRQSNNNNNNNNKNQWE